MKESGEKGFSKDYWIKNYDAPMEMDGIANRELHGKYIKACFDLEYVDINSLIDFGFGLGFLFNELIEQFKPYKAYGIEPSKYAFHKGKENIQKISPNSKLILKNIGLLEWAQMSRPKSPRFDLGICTSVFQYLTDEEIEIVLPVLSQRVKYLYLSVPTDKELDRQIDDLKFFDEFAIRRSREKYLKMISPYFTVISNRLLESKTFFDEKDTFFTDLLYRF